MGQIESDARAGGGIGQSGLAGFRVAEREVSRVQADVRRQDAPQIAASGYEPGPRVGETESCGPVVFVR